MVGTGLDVEDEEKVAEGRGLLPKDCDVVESTEGNGGTLDCDDAAGGDGAGASLDDVAALGSIYPVNLLRSLTDSPVNTFMYCGNPVIGFLSGSNIHPFSYSCG